MFTIRARTLAVSAAALFVLSIGGCNPSAPQGDDSGDGGNPGAGGTGGSGGKGGVSTPCEFAADCDPGAVCEPKTKRCSEGPLGCKDTGDCGKGAICTARGECLANQTGGPCVSVSDCPRGESCIGGYCGCMGERVESQLVEPKVMILLDKSGSMDRSAGGPDTKWEIAARAIENLLAEFDDQIHFGLLLYPEGRGCDLGSIDVDVGPNRGPEILDALDRTTPQGSTPIGASLERMRDYAGIQDPLRPNYILLLTDGDERCGGDGEAAVRALRELEPEVRTFVVGFGDGVSPDELEAMAIAGGTAQSGGTAYFQADDEASLNAAFSTIGGMVLSCAYGIEDTGLALTPEEIFVYFDDLPVEHDPHAGWHYVPGSGQITFQGEACEKLRTGGVSDLVIVHGCPVPLD